MIIQNKLNFMQTDIKPSQSFIKLVLIAFFVASSFVSPEMVSGATFFIVAFIVIDPVLKSFPNQCPNLLFFWIILFIGMIGSIHNELYDVLRDFWYIANVILTLTFGYVVMWRMRDIKLLLRLIAYAALFVSIMHLSYFIINPVLFSLSFTEIRDKVGSGYFLPLLGIAIVIGDRKLSLDLFSSNRVSNTIAIVCIASTIMSFSRTHLMCLLTVFIVMNNFFSVKAILRSFIYIGVLLVIMYFFASRVNTADFTSEKITFFSKTLNSIKEVKISDYNNLEDINNNWRGFESYKAMQTFSEGNWFEHFFGRGLGTKIELGFLMELAGTEYKEIPLLHNGYMYLLVKTGFIGLSLYIFYFVKLLRFGDIMSISSSNEIRFSGLMLVLLSLIVLQTTFVVGGVFNKGGLYPVTFLIGSILFCYKNVELKIVR
jgi:hypothetical protein